MVLTEEKLQEMLHKAAETGAKRALEQLGLHDEDAAKDVEEMRSLLEAWRDVRRAAWQTFVQSCIKGLLLVIVLGTATYFWKQGQ
jgi:hypothetical protein